MFNQTQNTVLFIRVFSDEKTNKKLKMKSVSKKPKTNTNFEKLFFDVLSVAEKQQEELSRSEELMSALYELLHECKEHIKNCTQGDVHKNFDLIFDGPDDPGSTSPVKLGRSPECTLIPNFKKVIVQNASRSVKRKLEHDFETSLE